MSYHMSDLNVAYEVIDILSKDKINKTHIFNEVIRHYPRVFLSIYNLEYNPFIAEDGVEEQREEWHRQIEDLCVRNSELQRQVVDLQKKIQEGKTCQECLPDSLPESGDTLPGFAKDALLLFQAGAKIRAIKMVMSLTGCNLVKSKEFCEALNKRFGGTPDPLYSRG